MKPFININGKSRSVNTFTFVTLAVLFAVTFIAYFWMVFGGAYKFGGWLAVAGVIALTGEVTINGKLYAIVPWNTLRKLVNFAVGIFCVIYFWIAP